MVVGVMAARWAFPLHRHDCSIWLWAGLPLQPCVCVLFNLGAMTGLTVLHLQLCLLNWYTSKLAGSLGQGLEGSLVDRWRPGRHTE